MWKEEKIKEDMLMWIDLVIYLLISRTSLNPWHGASPSSILCGRRPLLTMAIPSCVSVCLEWWWYEIILFPTSSAIQGQCGGHGDPDTDTGLLYTFPFSLSSGLSTRIGQALGADQPSRAQLISIIGLTAATAFGISAAVLMAAVKSVWGRVYTEELQILELVSSTLPILGLSELGNSP
ncbi:hypothetical protein SAY86_029727 [Trapa natans]|uniref:Uncharacterized protein n=1 Tax=Trapa natans TaxID=22666 RepID=A0AAN7RGD9_TRANT|nr:hypothetical protein SAY86_029727 [Trapa natans]